MMAILGMQERKLKSPLLHAKKSAVLPCILVKTLKLAAFSVPTVTHPFFSVLLLISVHAPPFAAAHLMLRRPHQP